MRSVSSPRAVSMMIGTVLSRPELAAHVVAGAVRQHHVEEHEVGHRPGGLLERTGHGAGDPRVEALAFECLGQGLGDRALVLAP